MRRRGTLLFVPQVGKRQPIIAGGPIGARVLTPVPVNARLGAGGLGMEGRQARASVIAARERRRPDPAAREGQVLQVGLVPIASGVGAAPPRRVLCRHAIPQKRRDPDMRCVAAAASKRIRGRSFAVPIRNSDGVTLQNQNKIYLQDLLRVKALLFKISRDTRLVIKTRLTPRERSGIQNLPPRRGSRERDRELDPKGRTRPLVWHR